ncbi:helix-turn-helix transcriptional regulator [Geodermatophilus ruber]|uniref:Transcriptional regulator, AraC family n=1 Tax=Geodermatophilus ruber TaxID=504800 RepID=A0A1I4K379_9ACTN|nr:AraC family transcriptional regulator [Geodermatophilus ruber]SFL73240.1 transcriptional regulator, AraC family [Geodermatophilus ruber]
MSPAPPLHRFPLCLSSDVEEFTARLNGVYYPAHVAPESAGRFPAPSVLNALHEPDFTLGYIQPGGSVDVTPDQDTTTHHVNLVLSGSVVAVSGRDEVLLEPGIAAVHGVRERHQLRARAGSRLIGMKFGRELVEGELGAMLGRPVTDPVRWTAGFDLRRGAGRSWLSLVEFTLTALDRPGLLDSPLVRRRQVRTLVAGLLAAQPHNYSADLADSARPLRPRTVRRALEHIHEHYAQPLTVTDLAAAAGSSARRLQEAFGAHLGQSPMSYLRDVRLDQVRRLLADGGSSVTEAALACGFTHLGRFSAAYRERFGELPSRTRTG